VAFSRVGVAQSGDVASPVATIRWLADDGTRAHGGNRLEYADSRSLRYRMSASGLHKGTRLGALTL
jgi:hypothetical protein